MAFFDPSFTSAAQQVQFPNYFNQFAQAYQISDQFPWSARKRREQAIQDWEMGMKEAEFSARMSQVAQENQYKQALLPYQIARAQRLAAGPATASAAEGFDDFGDLPLPPSDAPATGIVATEQIPAFIPQTQSGGFAPQEMSYIPNSLQ